MLNFEKEQKVVQIGNVKRGSLFYKKNKGVVGIKYDKFICANEKRDD